MLKRYSDTAYLLDLPDDMKARWCMLRAIEWGQWPLFVAQPVAPVALIFAPWAYVAVPLVILTWLWASIRYQFVKLGWAELGAHFVQLRWVTSIMAGGYLAYEGRYGLATLAALWPIATPILQFLSPPTKVGVLQETFARQLIELGRSH